MPDFGKTKEELAMIVATEMCVSSQWVEIYEAPQVGWGVSVLQGPSASVEVQQRAESVATRLRLKGYTLKKPTPDGRQ
jgi:hypothetical protein